MIAPFPPAGAVDIVAHFVAPCLGAAVNQLIVIENRQGAGGSIGSEFARWGAGWREMPASRPTDRTGRRRPSIVSMAWHSQSMP